MKKSSPLIVTSLVFVEWFEYSIYLYLGSAIASTMMPASFKNSLIFVYLIFSISYLSRPLGGLIFGYISDVSGRKKALLISGYVMTISTLCISLIPNYISIGLSAPLLLLLFRFSQGLAAGGEFNNSSILLMENSTTNKVISGSWTGFASSAGMSMGAIVAVIMSKYYSASDSWRYAYYIATVFSIVVLLARYKIIESYEYNHCIESQSIKSANIGLFKKLYKYKTSFLKVFIAGSFMSVYIYTCMIYFISYHKTVSTSNNLNPMLISMTTQILVTILIPVIAAIAQATNYVKILKYCIASICLASFILFTATQYSSFIGVTTAICIYAVANAGVSAVIFRYMYNLFPTHIRCLGTSTAWGLSAALLGATSPIIANIFVSHGLVNFPWLYILVLGLICLRSINTKKHNQKQSNINQINA